MSDEIIVQPTSYDIYVQRQTFERWPLFNVLWRGKDTWVVGRGGLVYDFSTGEWEVEPSPSNRSDYFITNTRRPLEVCIEKAKELIVNQCLTNTTNQDILEK